MFSVHTEMLSPVLVTDYTMDGSLGPNRKNKVAFLNIPT